MKRLIILALILTISFAGQFVFASGGPTVGTSKDDKNSVSKERSLSLKDFEDNKTSTGKRTSDSFSKGRDKQTSETIKAIGQAMKNTSADITVNLQTLYLQRLAELEATQEPFKSCQLVTAPKIAAVFGLTGDDPNSGYINFARLNNIEKMARNGVFISQVTDEKPIRQYLACQIYYGEIIAQAYLNLTGGVDNPKQSTTLSKDKEGNIVVRGLGYDDFVDMANEALDRTIKDGFTAKRLQAQADRLMSSKAPCRFDKTVDSIQCGPMLMSLGTAPQLIAENIKWYGDSFAGFQGSFKVSTGYSLTDSLEKLASTSEYEKIAHDVQKYAEEQKNKGNGFEANRVKKKLVDYADTGKSGLDLNLQTLMQHAN